MSMLTHKQDCVFQEQKQGQKDYESEYNSASSANIAHRSAPTSAAVPNVTDLYKYARPSLRADSKHSGVT